ncbi:MAG: DUF5312 domain-containing protein [Spirochaetaceae bacterium]|nr:DUF5312 domain-containing protein [Spirochaetaceae bacterium]MCF7948287.1 DUF5312 domain-containing protein [Spirochaetia bacterium]MCF7951781.1 DUF5312 domain-containing protein [Spirochaetaceae bacterium]
MDKLLEFFETLFLYVLYPRTEDRERRLELRRIWRELRYMKLDYIDQHGKKLASGYASKQYSLYKLVTTLRKTLQLPGKRQELLQESDLLEYLVLHQCEPQVRRGLNGFSYESLLDRIKHATDREAAWKSVEREWVEIIRHISGLAQQKLNNDLFQLELLYGLLEFDFVSLFKLFDSSFIEGQAQQIPRFSEVSAVLLDQHLLDFYFITAHLRVTPNLRMLLINLFEYYNEEETSSLSAVRESIDYIELLFENELSESTHRSLIQLSQQDPDYEPEAASIRHNYVEKVQTRLSKRFENSRALVKRELAEVQLKESIGDLLSGQALVDLHGYTRDNEEVFLDLGLNGFLYTLPLQVVKTYYLSIFSKGLLGSLRKIYEDGNYESSEFQQKYGEALREFSAVASRIDHFETQLQQQSGSSMESMLKMARLGGSSLQNFEVIEAFLNDVNRKAVKILDSTGKSAEELHRRIGAIIGDHRSANPKFISNIRVIGGDRNRDILMRVDQAYQELGLLLKIMRNYTVIGEVHASDATREKSA